ncbi:MAG: helix-turn-helix domain-containing protein [Nanoarchaeota archaeon]
MVIKEEFRFIKEEIDNLNQDNLFLNLEIKEIKSQLKEICNILENLSNKIYNSNKNYSLNTHLDSSTLRHINQTHKSDTLDTSTDNYYFKPLNHQNLPISIGNQGVSTDRQQTDNKQTDRQQTQNSIENAVEMLSSLDSLKKEIRLKFKRLTEQEILIFSTLYQLDLSNCFVSYKTLSAKLNLTESSIRDYIRRLINKGIPIEKNKLNNKSIQLSISNDLKKIATLSTILQLREI